MEPSVHVEGQVEALRHTLHFLVVLILSCLLLLFLLSCSLLLGWRPVFRRVWGRGFIQMPPASPQLFQVVPDNTMVCQKASSGATTKQLLHPPPRSGCCSSACSVCPLPPCSTKVALTHSSRGQTSRARPHFYSAAPRRGQARHVAGQARHVAAQGPVSFSSDLEKHPVLVPPNSPVTTTGTGSTPDGAFAGSCLTSTQEKLQNFSTSAARPWSVPLEYNSSIRCEDMRAQLNSANFTASQGPGLDTDFGASAGVSVRILSSDSEGSPDGPLLHRQQSGRFEWDYYDPSFERKVQLPHQPPPISSKQYWL